MTPTQEVVERIRPRLEAAIDASGVGWVKRNLAHEVAPRLALWELEILLSLIEPAAAAAIQAAITAALPYLAAEAAEIAGLILRLLAQPRSTYSAEVQVSAP